MKNILLTLLLSISLTACFSPRIINYKAENGKLTDVSQNENLQVMTWNIKFGGGRIDFKLDCMGKQKNMNYREVISHLDSICVLINKVNPDIIFLQEIDRKSKRSLKINQVQYILDHSNYLKYGIYSAQWKFGGRLMWQLGAKMNTGNAILSKYPISDAKTKLLPGDKLTLFKRHMQIASVDLGENTVKVVNLHAAVGGGLSAINKTLKKTKKIMDQSHAKGEVFVLGGDFNIIPPNNDTCQNFADAQCGWPKKKGSNYCEKKDVLKTLYEVDYLSTAINKENATAANNRTCSLSKCIKWTRKLDYIFTNAEKINGITIQNSIDYTDDFPEPMTLSDHAPILIQVRARKTSKEK